MAREQDYYTLARQYNQAIWDGINDLVALQREWNAMDFGNTLEPGAGANDGLVAADVGAVVFDTANAMVTNVLAAGHATNMANLL